MAKRDEGGSGSVRLIKRYSNRKLYDTAAKVYVNLDEIAEMVRGGLEVKVVEKESGEEITGLVLSQVLYEGERKNKGSAPLSLLKEIIAKGGSGVVDGLRKVWQTGTMLLDPREIEKNVRQFIATGLMSRDEGERLRIDLLGRARDFKDRVDGMVDERIRKALQRLDVPTRTDIEEIKGLIYTLQAKLEQLLGDEG